jgi:hypothetical protein
MLSMRRPTATDVECALSLLERLVFFCFLSVVFFLEKIIPVSAIVYTVDLFSIFNLLSGLLDHRACTWWLSRM